MIKVVNSQGDVFNVAMSKDMTLHSTMIAYFHVEPLDKDLDGDLISVDILTETLTGELKSLGYKLLPKA